MSDSQPLIDPILGRRFGSYVVEEKLGEGGMGAVYRAIQPEIGKQVAIKFLAPHLSQNPSVVQRFFAEARSVNLIQHDNIVDIFDFGQIDGFSFFVMELMKGTSLEALLQSQGRLAMGRAIDVAVQVADAIAAAHARNIIHRDLKPDNIFLVTRSGRADFVKLLDFGIAKLADGGAGTSLSRTMAGAVLGTPGYMSPEQGTGGAVDARTDVYALGVILFRMLAGRLPFEGQTFPEILQKQLIEPPPNLRALRPDLPPALAQLVHQMVSREVQERPEAMSLVLERLLPLLPAGHQPGGREPSQSMRIGGSSGPVRVVGPPSQPGQTTLSSATGSVYANESPESMGFGEPPARRKSGMALGIGASVVVVAAGVAWLGMGKRKTDDPVRPPAVTAAPPSTSRPSTPPAAVPSPGAVPAPSPSPSPSNVQPSPAPSSAKKFEAYVETEPEGAQMTIGGKPVGVTPGRVALPGESAVMKLHLGGYRDEAIEVTDGEHQVVRLHKESGRAASSPPAHTPTVHLPTPPPQPTLHNPPRPPVKKPAIGLDD